MEYFYIDEHGNEIIYDLVEEAGSLDEDDPGRISRNGVTMPTDGGAWTSEFVAENAESAGVRLPLASDRAYYDATVEGIDSTEAFPVPFELCRPTQS